jgi:hypothetical protein
MAEMNTFIQVLLYDFFEDSSVDVAQWRVVLNAISRAQRERIPAPNFDENRHAGVCAEVRQNASLCPVLYLMPRIVEVPLRCHHEGQKESLGRRSL